RGAPEGSSFLQRRSAEGAQVPAGQRALPAPGEVPARARGRRLSRLRTSRMNRLAVALTLAATAASAQPSVRIKLGTLAPQGSTWHQLLMSMAQDISKAANGKLELKIYAGGTQGNEGEMIRKISIGQLQAASITAIGLHEITPEPQAEDVPFMIDSYEEYDYVHEKVRAELESAIAKKGYQVLQWGEVGFVYLFSTQPYKTP